MTNVATLFQANQGTSVPSGFVGEVKFATQQFTALPLNPAVNGAQLTLTVGIWLCILAGDMQNQVPTDYTIRLVDSTNTVVNTDSYGLTTTVDGGNSSGGSTAKTMFVMRITTDTIYKVNLVTTQAANATNTVYFEAIRIA